MVPITYPQEYKEFRFSSLVLIDMFILTLTGSHDLHGICAIPWIHLLLSEILATFDFTHLSLCLKFFPFFNFQLVSTTSGKLFLSSELWECFVCFCMLDRNLKYYLLPCCVIFEVFLPNYKHLSLGTISYPSLMLFRFFQWQVVNIFLLKEWWNGWWLGQVAPGSHRRRRLPVCCNS